MFNKKKKEYDAFDLKEINFYYGHGMYPYYKIIVKEN